MSTHIRQFVYDASTRHFTGELSEMEHGRGFVRIWRDSADEGVLVVNPDTGVEVAFVIVDESRDDEGDLQYWLLKSTTGTRVDDRFTMTIYND